MNVPKLRFINCTETWRTYTLGELTELSDGTHFTPNYKSSGIPFWSVETITKNANVKFISEEEYQEINKRCNPKKDDILITRISSGINSLGVPKLVNWDTAFSIYVSVGLIKASEKFDSRFLVQYINTPIYKKDFLSKSLLTATPKKINMNNLATTLVKLPSLYEQKKIGRFLGEIDKKIQLQQEKVDLLKAQKKGFMQKIFSQELRFEGFSEEWSQSSLDKVANFFDNLRVPVTSINRIKGDIPYYGANGIQDYVEGFTHEGEFVLIAEDGANDLMNYPVNYVNGQVWVNNHAHVVNGKPGILDTLYLAYRLKNMNITPWLVGGSRAKLNGEVLKKIPISYPSFEEQKKIGEFFDMYNDKIKLQQEKLYVLQQQKQAFMQQMFV